MRSLPCICLWSLVGDPFGLWGLVGDPLGLGCFLSIRRPNRAVVPLRLALLVIPLVVIGDGVAYAQAFSAVALIDVDEDVVASIIRSDDSLEP